MQITEVKRISLEVVVCIFFKKNKILITSRPEGKSLSGFWEFPGGKVEKYETDFKALKREIFEELSVFIFKKDIFFFDSQEYEYPEYRVNIRFFVCRKWKGIILPKENQNLKWVYPKELENQNFLPSNKNIVTKLINHST
tara:strand:- start:461 stop:880 length:420 start_codon:yes stop_codon:yes gene_type:complete